MANRLVVVVDGVVFTYVDKAPDWMLREVIRKVGIPTEPLRTTSEYDGGDLLPRWVRKELGNGNE